MDPLTKSNLKYWCLLCPLVVVHRSDKVKESYKRKEKGGIVQLLVHVEVFETGDSPIDKGILTKVPVRTHPVITAVR